MGMHGQVGAAQAAATAAAAAATAAAAAQAAAAAKAKKPNGLRRGKWTTEVRFSLVFSTYC